MDAVKFIKERERLCKEHTVCSGCPANDNNRCKFNITLGDEAAKQVEFLEEWSAAHPRKTRQDVFLEQYPNAKLDKDGVLRICPAFVGGDVSEKYKCLCLTDCGACRHEFWSQKVE